MTDTNNELINQEEQEELKTYQRCPKCWCYSNNLDNHICDGLMLKLVQFYNLKKDKDA